MFTSQYCLFRIQTFSFPHISTLLILKPEYPRTTRSIPWLLIPWLIVSRSKHQLWYQRCSMLICLPSFLGCLQSSNISQYPGTNELIFHFEWCEMQIYFSDIFHKQKSARWGSTHRMTHTCVSNLTNHHWLISLTMFPPQIKCDGYLILFPSKF